MRSLCLLALLLLTGAASATETSLPPGPRPVEVAAGFFLADLSSVAERSETFGADIYLSFHWKDPRLAFAGSEPRRFLEDAAVERLKEIWWPQLEFVNTAEPTFTNRALEITPEGSVRYELGVSAEFRTHLDLRRFPFDHQTFLVRLQPFRWTREQMVFVADPLRIGFNPEHTFEGLAVTGVRADIQHSDLAGWPETESFSEFVASIDVERQAAFYLWTVFAPVILIFLISCAGFAVPIESFSERIGISLTALLACVATQSPSASTCPRSRISR